MVLRKKEFKQAEYFFHPIESSSLAFQFLLSEFIKAMQEVRLLEMQLERYLAEKTDTFQALIYPLTELCGGTMHSMRLFLWESDEGTLNKLNKYVYAIGQRDGDNRDLKDFQNNLEKGLHDAKEVLKLLKEAMREQTSLYLRDEIERHSKLALRYLKKLPKCISSLLKRFKHDENVLFFLLRTQGALKEIYGKRFLLRFFEGSCPGGVKSVARFLLTEYSRRGFAHLSQNINEKLTQLRT